MPNSCETLKYWDQNFKKSLRGTEYDNWFCGLWKIWYYIIDMTILLNISMSHIKMSTKILYHITYLNLRYNIRYLYQRYYIFNITGHPTAGAERIILEWVYKCIVVHMVHMVHITKQQSDVTSLHVTWRDVSHVTVIFVICALKT